MRSADQPDMIIR